MSISGVGSWVPTIDEFAAHWSAVNVVVGLAEYKLLGAYSLANFNTDRTALIAQLADVEAKANLRQTAAGDRDVKRAAIRPRLTQFGPTVRGALPGTRYIKSLPKPPSFLSSAGVWRRSMSDMADLWAAINTNTPAIVGFTPPLLLSGAYAQAAFVTEKTAMDAAFSAVDTTDQNAEQSRVLRDFMFSPMYQRMKQYRLGVAAVLPLGHPLSLSIPALTPPPGHTPTAVNVSASWIVGILKARITFTASTDPDLLEYELRACFGASYKTSEEEVIASLPAGSSPLQFETDDGLVASGSKVFYRVYVKLTTGNEKGSKTVSVTRP